MRVIVTGATGNVGRSLLDSLSREPSVTEIVGVARRMPQLCVPKTRFVAADVATDDLTRLFEGADSVVHLAWLQRSQHGDDHLEKVNVRGSLRVFASAVRAKVRQLVVASSVGAYAAGPKDEAERVDEQWPTTGIPTSLYSRQKARVERALDELELSEPGLVVTRIRPSLVFKRGASSALGQLSMGGWLLPWRLGSHTLRVIPDTPGLCLQAVHSVDVGDAFCRAVARKIGGAFNIAAEPALNTDRLVRELDATPLWLPRSLLRGAVTLSYGLGLQPTNPGWVDLALECPLMSTAKARAKLGWVPKRSSIDALRELLGGREHEAGMRMALGTEAPRGPAVFWHPSQPPLRRWQRG